MKKQVILTIAVLLIAVCLSGSVFAAEEEITEVLLLEQVYVSTDGSDDTGDGTEINPFSTIGKGITSVNPNGTVNVADGTYYEHLTINKNLNLLGQSQENTIIDGNNTGRPITIETGAKVNITLFTIQNGLINEYEAKGGGIYNKGDLTLVDCTIENNQVNSNDYYGYAYGAGIYNDEGILTIQNSKIQQNTANARYTRGGGIFNNYGEINIENSQINENTLTHTLSDYTNSYGAGIYNNYGIVSITSSDVNKNVITHNVNNYNYGYGGGIFSEGGSVIIQDSNINENTINGYYTQGGGIYNSNGIFEIKNSKINQNQVIGDNTYYNYSYAHAGGIYNSGTMTINDSEINYNSATATGSQYSYAYGGGIVNGRVLIINRSKINENSVNGTRYGYGGGILNWNMLIITDSEVNDNTVTITGTTYDYNWIAGGGIYNSGSMMVERCDINQNALTTEHTYYQSQDNRHGGAGIYNEGSSIISESNINLNSIISTSDVPVYGAGILNRYGSMKITSSNILDNTITAVNAFGGGIYNYQGTVQARYNRIAGNSPNAAENNANYLMDLKYNWWGSNNPDFTTLISGIVNYSPWLYMAFQANPTTILEGETSTLTANFNNAFDGNTLTALNPADGHLMNGILVTFTTDLGELGSKTVDKPLTGGVATATLTGTESGLATVKAALDTEEQTNTVQIGVEPPETGIFTRLMVQDAARRVRNFITSRGVLPNWVRMEDTAGITHHVTMPVFLELSTASLISTAHEFKAMEVGAAPRPTGPSIVNRNLQKAGYMDMALRVNKFIRNNRVAPNFASSPLGNIRYQALVDTFARIVAFEADRGVLPNYVVINTNRVR